MEKPIKIKQKKVLRDFIESGKCVSVVDSYQDQLEELFLIRNPKYKFNPNYKSDYEAFKKDYLGANDLEDVGEWFYFPWSSKAVHYLPEKEHQELRTARNRNIITEEEQEKFYSYCISIAGMSVGSHAVLTIAMMGGAKKMKIADPDEISGSNLNRLRYGYNQVGRNKAQTAAEIVYEMNPYAELEVYEKGISSENLEEFLKGADVFIEEMDNLELKIASRLKAKDMGIPVLMATDNGDNVIMDIERYDKDPGLEIFNGAVAGAEIEELKNISPEDVPKLATKIAGSKFINKRMQESLFDVGINLYSWPQLGSAATLSGAVVAYTVKRLSLGLDLESGKYEVSLDSVFDPKYNSLSSRLERRKNYKNLNRKLGL